MRIRTILFTVAASLLLPLVLCGQDDSSGETPPDTPSESSGTSSFVLTGRSFLETQYADRQGVGQDLPAKYARLNIAPTAILFDIPFTANILLSTEQSRGRQSINSFNLSFSLDQEQLQERLRQRLLEHVSSSAFSPTIEGVEELSSIEAELNDPSRIADLDALRSRAASGGASTEELEELQRKEAELKELRSSYEKLKSIRDRVGEAEELKTMAESGYASEEMYDPDHLRGALNELDMLSGMERFLYNFPRFGIGVNYPVYSPYTVNGVAVNGVDVVFNPGKFYTATTIGKAKRDVPEALADDTTYIAFDRNLYAGRIGYGKENSGHVILTGLYAGDKSTSVIVDTSSSFYLAPQENFLLGLDLDLPIVPDVFHIRGEIAGSLLTGDLSSPTLEIDSSLNAPGWLTELIGFRTSSFLDMAFSIEPRIVIKATDTRIKGSISRIGPGYVTLGIPYLRNDFFRYEGDIEQKFLRKQITVTGRYRHENDNLIEWKRSTTVTSMFGIGLGLNFRNLPFLRLNYMPYRQTNDAQGEFQINNRITLFNATIGHRYRLGNSLSGLTTGTFILNDVVTLGNRFDSESKTYSISQMFNVGSWLTLQATGSLTDPTSVVADLRQNKTLDVGGTVVFLTDWNGTLGGTLFDEEDAGTKTGFYAGLFIPINVVGSIFEIRAEKNVFNTQNPLLTGTDDFDEFILRASVSTEW